MNRVHSSGMPLAGPPVAGNPANRVSYLTINPQAVGTVFEKLVPPGRTEIIQRQANAMQGKLNIGGSVTLTGTSTTLIDSRIGNQSLILFMALDAGGANAFDSIYVTNRIKGQATLNHQNSTATLEYVVIG